MPLPDGKQTYYEFFGLNNFEPDPVKIKRAFRSMALRWHPDRVQDKAQGEAKMKQVNEVYKVLSNNKAEYDRHLRRKLNIIKTESTRGTDYFGKSWFESRENIFTEFKWNFEGEDFFDSMSATNTLRRKIRIKKFLETMTDEELERCETFLKMFREFKLKEKQPG